MSPNYIESNDEPTSHGSNINFLLLGEHPNPLFLDGNKLMKLDVDFGDHVRSILAGIKQERENPKEIEGKQALFVVNLPERKMAGELSQGMLFDIGYADKIKPCLAMPEKPVPNGSRAG